MPAFKIPPDSNPFQQKYDNTATEPEPSSPPAPPYSPITPKMSNSLPAAPQPSRSTTTAYPQTLPSSHAPPPTHTAPPHRIPPSNPLRQNNPPPPPQPLSLEDNPDAIALKAAISILQLQRQQALRDLKTLEGIKKTAVDDPGGFAEKIRRGEVRGRNDSFDALGVETGEDDEDEENIASTHNQHSTPPTAQASTTHIPQQILIPTPQPIIRTPPINWSQYHILPLPLSALHTQQTIHPSPGLLKGAVNSAALPPSLGGTAAQNSAATSTYQSSGRGKASVIAAPYDPFTDTLPPVKSASGGEGVSIGAGEAGVEVRRDGEQREQYGGSKGYAMPGLVLDGVDGGGQGLGDKSGGVQGGSQGEGGEVGRRRKSAGGGGGVGRRG